MRKHKNNFNNQKRTVGFNHSVKMPIEENLMVRWIRKLETILIILLIIIAIILFVLAIYNENNYYIWFDKEGTLILYILSILIIFICSPIAIILEIIANRID